MNIVDEKTTVDNSQSDTTQASATPAPVNTVLLIQIVNELAQRVDALLDKSKAHPDNAIQFFAIGTEIEELTHNLAFAATALDILTDISCRVEQRACAYNEVFGTLRVDEQDFPVYAKVPLWEFGEYFCKPSKLPKSFGPTVTALDEDVPF